MFFYKSVLVTIYADSLLDIAQSCNTDMRISITTFSWFSDFALYVVGYLMFEHNNLVMSQYDLMFDLKLKVDQS